MDNGGWPKLGSSCLRSSARTLSLADNGTAVTLVAEALVLRQLVYRGEVVSEDPGSVDVGLGLGCVQ